MTPTTLSEIAGIACTAGRIVLENGGEIYRVENTVRYICKAYGIDACESYATPTNLIVTVSAPQCEPCTRMLRITSRGVNLARVTAVNDLSRSLLQQPLPTRQAAARLEEIATAPVYPLWQMLGASALGTAAFTVVFGGTVADFAIGLLLGALLRLLVYVLRKRHVGDFLINFIGGGFAALGSWLPVLWGISANWWVLSLSCLMLLVPGLLLTNALRDIAAGDLVAGLSRLIEALAIVAALASGAAITLMLLPLLGGVPI